MPEKKHTAPAIVTSDKDELKSESEPITQSTIVQDMNQEAEVANDNKDVADGAVVQFASPAAIKTVNDLVDDHEEPDRKTSKWVLVIVVLVLLILALGASVVYYFTQFSSSKTELVSPISTESEITPTPTAVVDNSMEQLQKVDSSDDVKSIKKDVDNTNLDDMGKEMNEIEGSL